MQILYINKNCQYFPVSNVHTHDNLHVKITTSLTEEGLAPDFNSISTTSLYPLADAMWRGVSQLYIHM